MDWLGRHDQAVRGASGHVGARHNLGAAWQTRQDLSRCGMSERDLERQGRLGVARLDVALTWRCVARHGRICLVMDGRELTRVGSLS